MKAFLLPSLFAFAAVSALAVSDIDALYPQSDSDALSGAHVEVVLDGTDAERVWCEWSQGDTQVRVHLLQNAVDPYKWEGTLPPCHQGRAYVRAVAEDAEGNRSYRPRLDAAPERYDIAENETDEDGLTVVRYPNFSNWSALTTLKNSRDPDTADWFYRFVTRDEQALPQVVGLQGTLDPATTNPVPLNGSPASGSIWCHKISTGVGSMWFKARMAYTNLVDGGELIIGKLLTKGPAGRFREWRFREITRVRVPPAEQAEQWYQFHLILQDVADVGDSALSDDGMANYIIYNNSYSPTGRTESQVDICNVVLTPLIPDVAIYKDEVDYAPGFPSVEDPIDFHVTVSNLYAAAPALYITPRLIWRQGETDTWKTNVMVKAEGEEGAGLSGQGEGTYVCTLAKNEFSDGPFEYYYKVSFGGYTPTFSANRYPKNDLLNDIRNFRFDWFGIDTDYRYLIHTNAWALYTSASGMVSECRSPASYPDFYVRCTNEDAPGSSYYTDYAFDRGVVPGSAAEYPYPDVKNYWGYTHRFDLGVLHKLKADEQGYPMTEAHYLTRVATDATEYPRHDIEIPAIFPYNEFKAKDGVRHFPSDISEIAVKTEDWTNAAPSFLEKNYAMQLVGPYTWQSILHVTNAVDAYFSVTGAYYAAQGETVYDPGPFEWLELDQDETDINPPMSGAKSADRDSSLRFFRTYPVPKTRTVTKTEEIPVFHTVTNTGWLVGIVTNVAFYAADYTNELGQAILPGVEDVAYWFAELEDREFSEEVDGVETNWTETVEARTIKTNCVEVSNGMWRDVQPWRSVNPTRAELDIYNCIRRPDRKTVTNANQKVVDYMSVTNAVRTWEVTENYVEYEPSNEDLVAEGWQGTSLRTRVQIDYDGFLMFRFCTTNGAYQIRRAAWQDFNTWQADDKYYWRSAGLYDMKTFRSDLEGRDLTPFRTSFTTLFLDGYAANAVKARGRNETLDDWWTDARDGEYWNGLIGKNATFLLERTASNPTSRTDTVRNGAILLNTYPRNEGALETSNLQSGDGRDTLSMRVRAYSDDDRVITYAPQGVDFSNARNYRVVARLRSPNDTQVSEGEHALSLVGYYEDPFNFWEARIVQKSTIATGKTGTTELKNWFEVHVYRWEDGERAEVWGRVWNRDYKGDIMGANDRTGPTKVAQWPMWNSTQNTTNHNNKAYDGTDAEYGLFTNTKGGGWAFAFDLRTETVGNSVRVRPAVYAFLQDRAKSSYDNGKFNLSTNYNGTGEARHCFAYVCDAWDTTADGGTTAGKAGFNLRDCGLKIAPYVYDLTKTGEELSKIKNNWNKSDATIWADMPISTDAKAAPDWDHNNSALYDRKHKIDVWKNVAKGTSSQTDPSIVTRRDPVTWYRVEVYRTDMETATNLFTAPIGQVSGNRQAAWQDDWDAYHGHAKDGVKFVKGWKWENVDFPMNFWDDAFLHVRAYSSVTAAEAAAAGRAGETDSLAYLAVDSLSCAEWRGKTVRDPEDADEEEGWTSRYAAIAEDGRTGRRCELNRSRANPNQRSHERRQAVQTPWLENGIGDVSFTYTVDGDPVVVRVGVLDSTGTWTTYREETLDPTDVSTPFYVYVATNLSGRIVVETDDPDAACRTNGHLGTLYVDNLRATDYPATGSTSWEAYNLLVSTFPADVAQRAGLDERELLYTKFDGISPAARSMRSAVLNDGPAEDTINHSRLDEHLPNLQTPSIETGIGEVSFWYRASPDNLDKTKPAKVTLLVAESPNVPDHLWVPLTAENLNTNLEWDADAGVYRNQNENLEAERAAMAALTNITTDAWTYFSAEFYQQNFRVLRIVSGDTNTTVDTIAPPNRVMIDNVLVTEPVRSSVDVGSIEFLPGVPLSTTNTGVKVTLVNPRMNPHDFEVYLDWFIAPGPPTEHTIRSVTYKHWEQEVPRTLYYDTINQVLVPKEERHRPGVVQVDWYEYVPRIDTNITEELTRIQPNLASSWGFEKWEKKPQGQSKGTISFRRSDVPGETLVFYSTNEIPTHTGNYGPDAVLQYCVRVKYKGRFAEDVLSETQGRVKNGYWFENPSWYEPIDLNVAFGTEDHPVSYAFLFSCPTNTAFINEFRGWMGATANASTYLPRQFVELIGPAGASLGNWRLEHWGVVSRSLNPDWIYFTNSISPTAVFHAGNNATTNKGWGFYVLANSGIERDEPLFPGVDETSTAPHGENRYIDPAQGAMRLRRSMGAYADAVSWGIHTKLDQQNGFKWMAAISRYSNNSRANYVYAILENTGTGELAWDSTSSDTVNGYNQDQEALLPWLDGTEEKKPEPPLLGRPVITGFSFNDAGTILSITFKACVTNGIALTAETQGVSWDVEAKSTLDPDEDWARLSTEGTIESFPATILAPETGEWSDEYTARIRVNPLDGSRFYRIRADVEE